ncbi:MAG: flagellar hook-associated protein FlgL [Planctomycetota bacterium]|jgi:flagellar hook-associated protein 3 FlgL
MSGFPGISRVTDSMVSGRLSGSIQRSLASLARTETSIATGRRFNTLGDDPLGARRSIAWERLLERHAQYGSNIQAATSRLSATEGALAELEDLIVRARELALEHVQTTSTDGMRANAAIEVQNMIEEALTLANRQFGDRFLFGGDQVSAAPFAQSGGYISYGGDRSPSLIEVAPGMFLPSGISGVDAFGGWSSQVSGGIDLDPNINLETPVASLNGGRGIMAGRIEIRDGSGAAVTVDLEGAKTVGDVLDRINATGFVSAGLDVSRNGLAIVKPGANISITDLNGATAARDLGIAAAGAGPSLGGDDLDPIIGPLTRLSLLRNGLGIDAGGFTIQNGSMTAAVDLTGVETVEGLINAVNTAGIGVRARIGDSGEGIELTSILAGAELRVIEGSTTSAAQLGFIVPTADLTLDSLHGGTGVPTVTGEDLEITAEDGTTFAVDIDGAVTLGDVVALINEHPGNTGAVLAEVVPGQDRIRLRDQSGGTGALSVSALNESFAISGLRLDGEAVDGIIEGGELSPAGVRTRSAFDGFMTLSQGLLASDTGTIHTALRFLDSAHDRVLQSRAEVGSRLRRLEVSDRRNQLQSFETESLLSQEADTDIASAIVELNRQQTAYQAALRTSAQLLQQSILDFLG